MSNKVSQLVRNRNLGIGLTPKALLLLMADYASDDGSGVWAAKATMARELETTDRTIRRTTNKLVSQGFITAIGHRKNRNGKTIEYQLNIQRIEQSSHSHLSGEPTVKLFRDPISSIGRTGCHPMPMSQLTVCPPPPDPLSAHEGAQGQPNQTEPNKTFPPSPQNKGTIKNSNFGVSEKVRAKLRGRSNAV